MTPKIFISGRVSVDLKMSPSLLLCCLVLCSACWEVVNTHMLMEEMKSNQCSTTSLQNQTYSPPIIIVELSGTSKKVKKSEKKSKKTKTSGRVKRPPPPNCIPLWASCKGPNSVCCDPCAFCKCRILRTVCFCRMGYPRC